MSVALTAISGGIEEAIQITPEEIAEAALEEAKRDKDVRALVHDHQMFDGLTEHAGWRHLRKRFEEKRDFFLENVTRRVWRGEEVSQREIDFQRGYYQGIFEMLEAPDRTLDRLELRGKMAFTASLLRLERNETEGEDAPYG